MKINKRGKIVILTLLLVLVIFLMILCIKFFPKNNKNNYVAEPITLSFESRIDTLNKFDSGIYYKFGWLQVQGTHIDLPILDSRSVSDEIDYSYGWLSPNVSTNENRLVLLGHNVLNVSSSPMRPNEILKDFEELMAFVYYDFARDNLYIQYTKDNKDEIYLIYGIGFYDYDYKYDNQSLKDDEVETYIDYVKENSLYNYDIDVNKEDTLLTIKTCTRYFGAYEKQQLVIDARKLRDDEDTLKYQVTQTKKYDELIKIEESL